MRREVHFIGTTATGEQVAIVRKGWNVKRGDIVSLMEKRGCYGDVFVSYFEGTTLKRTVVCGI